MKSPQSAIHAALLIIGFVFSGFKTRAQVAPTGLPNIVFIMADDGRYDEYRVTGGPDWFIAPNIERIALEGANFSRTYAPTPICGPSRASIYTGLYAHQHKTANNGDTLNTTLPKIQDILHDQGYYTGFIGKYGNGFLPPFEFDYWVDIGDNELYKNFWIKVNGENVFIPGHITNSFNEYINAFFDSVTVHSDQPFALFFFPLAPHTPNTPRATDAGLYIDEVKPFPENFYPYDSLYPEFYNESGSIWVKDTIATEKFIQDRFSCLIGLDENINKIFNRLDTTNITDSTFIIYTSDNGYISGEHMMRAKALPIDESIHVPLFIRYPEWFAENTIIDNEIIELIDIPKTLLEIANVEDTFDFAGLSIRELAEPDTMRHYAFYAYEGSEPGDLFDVPDLRGLRGFNQAYYYSNCDCFTEEFYDFTIDPHQNQNLILNQDYQDDINQFRTILQAMRIAKKDTAAFQMNSCKLAGAYEIPDGYDNDCDGLVDDSLDAYIRYADTDADGFGDADAPLLIFGEMDGYVNNYLDCDDGNNAIHPVAAEICDGIDNDCDGLSDEYDPDIVGLLHWYADADNDGFGNPDIAVTACDAPADYVNIAGDCDDANALISAAAAETCNGIDDDCDGLTDDEDAGPIEGQVWYYADMDNDSFGDISTAQLFCFMPDNYVLDNSDCNDTDSLMHPLAVEICNGIDDNCNWLTDDEDAALTGSLIWYADADADGYGNVAVQTTACFAPPGYTSDSTDCDDAAGYIYPGAIDFCDGTDNDCDDEIDEDIIIPVVENSGPLDFCSGGLTHLSANPVLPGYQVQWYRNGLAVADANNTVFDVTKTGNYHVKFTAPAGCVTVSTTTVIMVTVPPVPTINNLSVSNDLCKNNPVKLHVKNIEGNDYQWYKGLIPIAGANTHTFFASTPGNYKVQQTDVHGCIGTSKMFTVVHLCDEGNLFDENNQATCSIYPNPNTGNFIVKAEFNNQYAGNVQLILHNMIGDIVYEETLIAEDGVVLTNIATNNLLPSGIYIATIQVNQWQTNLQVILEK